MSPLLLPAETSATPDATPASAAIHQSDFLNRDEFLWADKHRYLANSGLPRRETHIDPLPAAVVGGAYVGMFAIMHATMLDAWWENSSAEFKLKDDWNTTLQVDKLGHMFGGYMTSYILGEGLLVAGFDTQDASLWASLAGLTFQTYIEVEDGFSQDWGFSLTDMAANFLGVSLYYAQWRIPELQYLTPKWQFVPPDWVDAEQLSSTWIDEYNTVTIWFSVDLHSLLPENLRSYWLPWLSIAAGYGIQQESDSLYRRYLLALDVDLVKLLPEGDSIVHWLAQSLNHVKLPAPALEFSTQGTRAFLLFPFEF